MVLVISMNIFHDENSNCNKTFYNIEANMFYNSYAIYKYRTPNENINW